MSWRDRLRDASFRGVPFYVESTRREVAPLEADHTIPGQQDAPDAVEVIPLGAGPRMHTIDAFLWGPEYDRDVAALEAALESPGPGALIHPYRGSMLVVRVGKIFTDHHKDRGGYARIRFTCKETSAEGVMVLRVEDVESPAEALALAGAALLNPYKLAAAAESVSSSVLATYEAGVTAVRDAYATVVRAVGVVEDVDAKLAELGGLVEDFIALPGETIGRVSSVFDELLDVAAAVESAPGRLVGALVGAVASFADALLAAEEARPSQRADEAELRRRTTIGLWAGVIGAALRTGASASYASRAAALQAREGMLDEVDRFIDYGAGNATADAAHLHALIHEARSTYASLLDQVAKRLPEVRELVVQESIPAIVLAYQLYGDPLREAEIVERNALATPDLIPAGTVLEVLR